MKSSFAMPFALSAALVLPTACSAHDYRPAPVATPLVHLAHKLDGAAAHVLHAAEAREHYEHTSRREALALRQLHTLAREAQQFHARIERGRHRAGCSWDDYRKLARAYDRAARTFGALRPDRHLQADFARVARLMNRIEGRVEGRRDDDGSRHRDHNDRISESWSDQD